MALSLAPSPENSMEDRKSLNDSAILGFSGRGKVLIWSTCPRGICKQKEGQSTNEQSAD
jgi:hypothetical protein